MPRRSLQAIRRILEDFPDCRVITLTTFDLDRYVYDTLAAGVSGFLLKDVTPAHLAAAVRLVGTGDAAPHPAHAPGRMPGPSTRSSASVAGMPRRPDALG
jgi:DNA-binding NarL/FixJ family response regulator